MTISIFWNRTPPKETTATMKESPNLLEKVKAKMYCGLKIMANKFRKYGQIENIGIHLENTPTYYIKYKKGRR